MGAPSSRKISNAMTNITGRTRTERIVSAKEWRRVLRPLLDRMLKESGDRTRCHKALIGRWAVEYVGNDPHMYEFFSKNWKAADAKVPASITSLVVNGISDREIMKTLLGFSSEAEVDRHTKALLEEFDKNAKYHSNFRDPKLQRIRELPVNDQREAALFAPATLYSPEDSCFASLNTNYYGQLKSKSSLGPLEEFLIRKAQADKTGRITNPSEVWLSMHAGCVEYATETRGRRGIVLIAPTGAGKSTQGYGLVLAKRENRLHSDDWVFVNLATREAISSEIQFYMRTSIAEIFPHLVPLLVRQPLENVPFSPETVRLIESFDSPQALERAVADGRISRAEYRRLVAEMIENNAARSLIDPRLMVGAEKFIEKTTLTDFFLLKRDYDSSMVLSVIGPEQMVEVLTSKENVFNYEYGKLDPDGYGIPQKRTTEIYYNPYLCICEADREKGRLGELDRLRVEAYRTLAGQNGVTVTWVNTRLPANQTQFCLRRFLEGGIDEVRLEKGPLAAPGLIQKLGLLAKDKPAFLGRRAADLVGIFDPRGCEVEVIGFYSKGTLQEAAAFLKGNAENKENKSSDLVSYSHGNAEIFFKRYAALGARELLAPNANRSEIFLNETGHLQRGKLRE